jgi:hypothetical protein
LIATFHDVKSEQIARNSSSKCLAFLAGVMNVVVVKYAFDRSKRLELQKQQQEFYGFIATLFMSHLPSTGF